MINFTNLTKTSDLGFQSLMFALSILRPAIKSLILFTENIKKILNVNLLFTLKPICL